MACRGAKQRLKRLVWAILEGRSQSFLVGSAPNQDAYDANTHLERLYGVYTSVWRGMEGSRGV